ncbi:MAG: TetR family transcriptional regulator [Kiritimatiellae bacterium]|nr:TetR family transcriptional regulator [Kiritimatiellia bacterium]
MKRSREEADQMRMAIIQKALECFATYGYALTTFNLIAKDLNITKSGVMWHFKSKECLLAAVIKWMHEQYTPFKGLEEANTLEELKASFMEWAKIVETFPDQRNFLQFILSRVEWSEDLREKVSKLLDKALVINPFLSVKACVARLKQSGDIKSRLRNDQIATLLMLTFFGVYREAFLRDQRDPMVTLEAALSFIIEGIRRQEV